MVRQKGDCVGGGGPGGRTKQHSRVRLPYAGKGAKKAGQAGLGGLGWRKGVVRLLRLEKRFKLEAGKEYGV